MGTARGQRLAQTRALVALIRALPDKQRQEVLAGIGPAPLAQPKASERCGICDLVYPACRARWAEDHDYERKAR